MSESERRRKYRWDRVLIETDRLFSPQFDDAVVYLTGAQLEMLRNATQNLRRPETYVSEYAMGYYLTPTVEDFDSVLEIVADLEEVLMGNPNTIWGYKDRWVAQVTETNAGEDPTIAITPAVPAGYVYVAEFWSGSHNAGVTRYVILEVKAGAVGPILYTAPALPSGENVGGVVHLTLKEDDVIKWIVYGLDVGEVARLRVWGYMMKVPE